MPVPGQTVLSDRLSCESIARREGTHSKMCCKEDKTPDLENYDDRQEFVLVKIMLTEVTSSSRLLCFHFCTKLSFLMAPSEITEWFAKVAIQSQ